MKRKNGILYTLLITFLVYALLTWIIPVTTYNGEFANQGMVRMGMSEVLSYPTYSFYNFIYIMIFLLLVGCLYGILKKVPAYRKLLDKIVDVVNKKEFLFTIITILLLSVIVSFTGLTYELMAIMPFIATIVLLSGKDKVSAALTVVGPIAVGIMGNIFSNVIAGTFVSNFGISFSDLIISKILLLVIGCVLLVVTIRLHDKKVIEEEKDNSDVFFIPEKVNDGKVKVWPLVTIVSIFAVIKLIASISWTSAFSLDFFKNLKDTIDKIPLFTKYIAFIVFGLIIIGLLTKYLLKKKKDKEIGFIKSLGKLGFVVFIVSAVILGLVFIKVLFEDAFKVTSIFTKLYEGLSLDGITIGTLFGSVNALGSWTYAEYIIWIATLCIVLMITYRIKPSEFIDEAGNGMKGVLYASIICMLAYTMLICASNNPIMLTILKPLLTLTKGFNVLTYSLCALISSFFNSDFGYINYGVLSLTYASNAFADKTNLYPLVGLIHQEMNGLALLLAPTSIPLIFTLTTLNLSYKKWLKYIWKLFVSLLIVSLIVAVIVLLLI